MRPAASLPHPRPLIGLLAVVLAVVLASGCGGEIVPAGGAGAPDGRASAPDAGGSAPEAPGGAVAPIIGTFSAMPGAVVKNTPTTVAFVWTYANTPSPTPTCAIDGGVGAVGPGGSVTLTLAAAATYTLICSNAGGSGTSQLTLTTVDSAVAPALAGFTATPAAVVTGAATSVTFAWTYSNTPTPAPTCTIDHGVGAVPSGAATSLTLTAATTYTLSCGNAAGTDTAQVTVTTVAAAVAPAIATFTATPATVTANAATNVTFAWTYSNTPTPAPACAIDNGIGALPSGAPKSVTLAAATTYTLTCTNGAGSDTATTTVAVSGGGGGGGGTALCAGLVTDKNDHPMTSLSKPARLAAYTDPAFGTTVRRLTDVAAQFGGQYAKPAYSTMPAWNADESYLILYVVGDGHKLFNGTTYEFIRDLAISPADLEHIAWSGTDPDALYYPSGSALKLYRPSTNASTTVKTFSSSVSFGGDPIYGDWKADLFGFAAGTSGILWTRTTDAQKAGAGSGTPAIGASGSLYVQGSKIYDATSNAVLRSMTLGTSEHGAIGMLANGQDIWAAVQFDLSGSRNGNIIVQNLTTGAELCVVGECNGWGYPRTGTHISAHAVKNPGWVAASITGDPAGQDFLDQEIVLADVNTGTVCRVAHHRSAGQEGSIGYWAEPHANISPRGTRVLFASDWNDGSTVDTYVVELPSYGP